MPEARTEPWVTMDKKNKSSVGAALSARAFALSLGSAAPVGGSKKCVSIPNPGLAPWAMQEYRLYRAHLRLYQSLAYFDALALAFSNQMLGSFDVFALC